MRWFWEEIREREDGVERDEVDQDGDEGARVLGLMMRIRGSENGVSRREKAGTRRGGGF